MNIPGYGIIQCDRNRNGGGVACYIRKDMCVNTRTRHYKEIENLVFDIILPESKLITVGVFYRPLHQTNFIDFMVENFSNLNLVDNEIYLFGDFHINLFQNGNYILNRKRSTTSQRSIHMFINRYKELCQTYSFEQLITCPTGVTSNISFLIDHISINSTEKTFESGIINSGISDHQQTFCTRKVKSERS